MVIQVDPDELAEKSKQIHLLKGELDIIMNEIEILILTVSEIWQGNAERAYSENILYVKNKYSGMAVFFEQYARLLEEFAKAYEQQEVDLASKINLS